MNLSVVIPTFNEIKNNFLERILERLTSVDGIEIICADSNSSDGTRELIQKYNCTLVDIDTNLRSIRQNVGIENATYDLILLHHPRSLLSVDGLEYLMSQGEKLKWGGFTHSFDMKHYLLDFTSWYSNEVRVKKRGILYLDHCIFFRKSLVRANPIVPEIEIFEDTALSENLQVLGHPTFLPFPAITSAIRFQHNGIWRQSILNQALKIGYLLKVPQGIMNSFYEKGLSLNSKYLNK